MNLNKNYYSILGVSNKSSEKEVKKAYYKLSFTYHPDRGGDANIFSEITEAYDVLCSDIRTEYDQKSKFGNNYNEYFELFNININYDYDGIKSKRDNFKKNEINDIIVEIDDKFNGGLEFERWVKCKSCDGSGKDMSSKIVIRDTDGNVLKMFDGEDGCDLCEGSGEYNGKDCPFCYGAGKVGLNQCKTCNGEKRILGKQKLKGIKLEGDETRVKSMGHYGKGRIGDLIIKLIC
jgi:DnaJ-class molecular chaperone